MFILAVSFGLFLKKVSSSTSDKGVPKSQRLTSTEEIEAVVEQDLCAPLDGMFDGGWRCVSRPYEVELLRYTVHLPDFPPDNKPIGCSL